MTLIIGATPYSQWQPLVPLLEHLGWQAQPEDAESWYQGPSPAAEHTDGNRYLLLHTRPEYALAQAIDEGEEPYKAFEQWRHCAERLLAFYKGHRHQAAMVECTSAIKKPRALLKWLNQSHPGFSGLPPLSADVRLIEPPGQPASNLSLLLATQLVAQAEDVKPMLAQLEASTLPLTEEAYNPPQVDVNAVYRGAHYQALRKTEGECQELKEENDLILKQLFQVQEELEQYFLQVKELQSQERRLGTDLTDKAKQLENVKADLALARLEMRHAQKKLLRFEHSKVWRMIAPFRKLALSLHKPSRRQKGIDQQVKLVKDSEYFDPKWYIQRYPDIVKNEVEPAEHYVMYGGREGRAASVHFASKEYLRRYPDVANAGLNPLVHYLEHGKAEGRKAPKLT